MFLVEGVKGVDEALDHAQVDLVVVEGNRRDEDGIAAIITKAASNNVAVEFAGRKDISALKATETFPGVMAVLAMKETDLEELEGFAIFLDRINDPGNLGTIIRTADWFGIKNIVLSEGSVDPYNEKVVRSSMGSLFRANIYQSDDALEDIGWLKEKKGYALTGFVLGGQPIEQKELADNTLLVFGSESHGLSPEIEKLLDTRYTIAGSGEAESLNLAISVGIALYALQS